jgi:hypothetical protein
MWTKLNENVEMWIILGFGDIKLTAWGLLGIYLPLPLELQSSVTASL